MSSTLRVNELQNLNGTSAMTIDTAGRILQPAKPVWTATLTSGDISSTADIVFNNEVLDQGGGYDTSTGKYTAPITGIYWVQFNITFNAQSGDKQVEIYVNSSDISIQTISGMPAGQNEFQASAIGFAYQLTAGDTIYAKCIAGAVEGASGRSSFSGYLLS